MTAANSTVVAPAATVVTPPASEASGTDSAANSAQHALGLVGIFSNLFSRVNSGQQQTSGMTKQAEANRFREMGKPTELAVQYNGYLTAQRLQDECSSLDAEGRKSYNCGVPVK